MRQHSNRWRKVAIWVSLVGIILLAWILRSHSIETLPAGVYPDEATNATDALRALETNDFKLFYENNYGREGLFINLQALALKFFGISIFALKFWSMIFGTLTVLGVYFLAKELWQKPVVALGSAYLTAVSFWAINFSRIGFRAIMVPFLLVWSFYFFVKGLRTKRLVDFALSGFTFGLGLHTYIAFRLAPLILVVFSVGLILSYQHFLQRYWKHALAFVLFAALSAAPMLWDYYRHPDHFLSRSSSISIFEPSINHGHLGLTFLKTLGLSLSKYTFWGDQNWRHNYPPYPVLDPITGILFLAGLIYLVPRIFHLLSRRFQHEDRNKELAFAFLLFGWLLVMLMPEFLTNEGLPHALRSIGTLPAVILIASLPFLWMHEKIKLLRPGARLGAFVTLGILFVSIGLFNGVKYFVFFNNNPQQHGAFNENYKNMATYLKSLPPETHKYVFANAGGTSINNGLPVTAQPITFLTYRQVENLEFLKPETEIYMPGVIVMMKYDEYIAERIKKLIPHAQEEKIDLSPGYGSDFTAIVF